MPTRQKVVITGLGAIAPNGTGVDEFWANLLTCKSGIGPITLFDTTDFPVRIAGEVKKFTLHDYTNGRFNPRRMGRHTQLALAAAQLALEHAGVDLDAPGDIGHDCPVTVTVGVSSSAFDVIEKGKDRMARVGPKRASPYVVGASQPHAVATVLAESIPFPTQCTTISSACAAGLQAIETAAAVIRSGKADIAIAGGSDAPITPFAVASFGAAGLLPSINGNPSRASRPFDYKRSGGIMAEGAAMIILESLEHAIARGAHPLAEIRGYGAMLDEPGEKPASGLKSAMSLALANSGLLPEDVPYVCAHGPSDPILDLAETEAIKSVFGNRAYRLPVSSIKGVTGNPLAAAGPLQVTACIMAMLNGQIPPTANYEVPDPLCDLDYVPNQPRAARITRALINVHGMGGGNCSLLVEGVENT